MIKQWLGKKKCDLCGTTESKYFVDGKTNSGPWAFQCATCWQIRGVLKLGAGFGQKYNGTTFVKIEG